MSAAGEPDGAGWVSKIVSIQGRVLVRRHGQTLWQTVQLNDTFFAGDQIHVEVNSRAGIVLSNDAQLRVDQNTFLIFTEIEQKRTFIFKLLDGAANFFSHRPRSLKILTPFVNGVIEGTEFFIQVDSHQTRIELFDGRILAQNDQGTIELSKGDGAVAQAGKAPQRYLLVRPRESVQWAMYYPPVLALEPGMASVDLNQSLALFNEGQTTDALARLEYIGSESRDATFYICRAAMRLHVGRIAQAQSDIEQALAVNPQNGNALALKAIIAVVQNRVDAAVDLGRHAVQYSPRSASAHIALSYALQAQFKLSEALDAAQEAVVQAPGSGLAWARLADLLLSAGALDKGVSAARKAVALAPHTAHAHTVLGFAHLTRIATGKAREAFNQAIMSDSAAPLPRLGLGLATIRDGDLKTGRSQLEIAAGLDPGNSLIRSYLGKAYFDEKRDPQDGQQFEIAKTLDPNDPTPWFYDAIRKQSLNRPVEALHDLQKSIELNDNRALYRSRLMLDSDRAARGVSLARIYDDLGFKQWAIVESTKSMSIDPANHSAHRFLSDTYTRLPQRQIAQVSELLQAQLLQPINTNPVQPRLSTNVVNIVSDVGPGEAAFNEYTPLFERNRPHLTLTGVAGNNDTFGDEIVLSGIYDVFSYSVGQYHYETDGFREDSDAKHDVYNVFTQVALTHKINMQLEYRNRDTTQGDTRLYLNPDFSPTQHRNLEHNIGRFGLHISPSPQSDFIGSFIYSNRKEDFLDQTANSQLEVDDDREGYDTEAQYIFRQNRFNILFGGGVYRVNVDKKSTSIVEPILPPFPMPSPILPLDPIIDTEEFESDSENLYFYTNIRFPDYFVWTMGISYETYNQTQLDSDIERVNPKFGLQWDITQRLRFRTAFIENIKRQLVVDQTIEPTQVSGFNQFYDDFNGTVAQLYGVAIDSEITDELYGGAEFIKRNLTKASDMDQEIYRGFLYWAPHEKWSFTSEYQLERDLAAFDLETTMIPLSIRYFGSGGFFGQFGITFVWQKMDMVDESQLKDHFEVVDVSAGYRLPKRRGVVSLEVRNLFDEEFRYRDASFKTSEPINVIQPFYPERSALVSVILNF